MSNEEKTIKTGKETFNSSPCLSTTVTVIILIESLLYRAIAFNQSSLTGIQSCFFVKKSRVYYTTPSRNIIWHLMIGRISPVNRRLRTHPSLKNVETFARLPVREMWKCFVKPLLKEDMQKGLCMLSNLLLLISSVGLFKTMPSFRFFADTTAAQYDAVTRRYICYRPKTSTRAS